jgi:hypothetical protein
MRFANHLYAPHLPRRHKDDPDLTWLELVLGVGYIASKLAAGILARTSVR